MKIRYIDTTFYTMIVQCTMAGDSYKSLQNGI